MGKPGRNKGDDFMPLKYYSEDDEYIKAECSECGKVLKISRGFITASNSMYKIDPPGFKCVCGTLHTTPFKKVESSNVSQTVSAIKCPKCGSTQITAGNKGFGLGKAAVGGALLGPVGLLGGLIGSKKVMVTCLNCGKQWQAGK